jgi:putative transposase
MQMNFVMEVLQRALERATPRICNSDQGSQFTSPKYTQLLLSRNVRISMASKGRALDNIFTKRLWRTIKYEEIYLKDYASPREAREGLREYLHFYNEQRLHQTLEYRTQAEVYFAELRKEIVLNNRNFCVFTSWVTLHAFIHVQQLGGLII